jgi:hypothetical protein
MVEIGSVAASCGASDVELSFAGRRGAAYRFAALPIEEKRLEPGALIFATQDCLGLRPLLVRAADEADGADLWRKAREMGRERRADATDRQPAGRRGRRGRYRLGVSAAAE